MWIRLSRHKRPKSWESIEDPVVLLERNSYGHPLAGPLWERQFEEVLLEFLDGKQCRIGNVCLFIENTDYSYRCTWMTQKMIEESRAVWKKWIKLVDLGERTSFLDHV